MLHDNVLSALKQVSDIPIHLGKLKTSYGCEFYGFTFQEQKLQHNSCWAVNDYQVLYHPTTSSPPVLRPLLILVHAKALVCHLEINNYESGIEVLGHNPHTWYHTIIHWTYCTRLAGNASANEWTV